MGTDLGLFKFGEASPSPYQYEASATGTGSIFFYCNAAFETDSGTGTWVSHSAGWSPAITPSGTAKVRSSNSPTHVKFSGSFTLTSVSITKCSTVTNLGEAFLSCRVLTSCTISGDTSNVTNMIGTFQNCFDLVSLPAIDTSAATDMSNVCYNCRDLTSVPLWNTANVTKMTNAMRYTESLSSFPLWNTSKVTNFGRMFQNSAVTTIPALDLSKGDSFTNFFRDNTALTSLPALNTILGTTFGEMFRGCSSLATIAALDTTNTSAASFLMFDGCISLTSPNSAEQTSLASASGFDFN